MRMLTALVLGVVVFAADAAEAQTARRPPTRSSKPAPKPAAKPVPPRVEPAKVTCPESLGTGVKTGTQYLLRARRP